LPRRQKRAGKNLQLNRRKAAGNTLPRRVAGSAAGYHDEVADIKSIYYIRRTSPLILQGKSRKQNRREKQQNA